MNERKSKIIEFPLKDINKIAGPMIEAWAFEVFAGIRDDSNNIYSLINLIYHS